MDLIIQALEISGYPNTSTPVSPTGTSITFAGITHNDTSDYNYTTTGTLTTTLTITRDGFKTYSNTFTIYESGLNEIVLDIFLEPLILDSTNSDYLKTYPNMAVFPIPCSYNVEVVDLSSGSTSYKYYIDKEVASTQRNFIFNSLCGSTNELVQELININPVTSVIQYDSFGWYLGPDSGIVYPVDYINNKVIITPDTINNITLPNIQIQEYNPLVTIQSSITNNACAGGDCDCIPLNLTILISPTVVLNNINTNYPVCATSTLTYTLIDYLGNTINTTSFSIDNTIPVNDTLLTYTFSILEIGDYTLNVSLTNCCGTCSITEVFHGCDFLKIEETSCHNYTIRNCSGLSSNDVTFTITDLDNNVVQSLQDIVLNYSQNFVFTSTQDGIYQVIVKDNTSTIIRIFLIIDLCTILSCITNKILDILCPNCGCKSKESCKCQDWCKKNYNLERIHLLYFDLMNRVNKEYRLNSYYTTIDQAKINDLKSTQEIIDSLVSYCDSCGDTSTNFGIVINNSTSNSDCGCS